MNKPLDSQLLSHPDPYRAWEQEYAATIGADKNVSNRSGIAIQPLYTERDWSAAEHAGELGLPGQPPYTRGIYATMHRGRTWSQRQLIGHGTPAEYNERLREILAQGATAISLIPCNSVFRGYDMDESHIELLGTCGTVINTTDHMDRALEGVDLARTSCAQNDPVALHAAGVHARRREAARHRLAPDQRHLQPERLPEPLRRQPHVLPHRAARCAAHPGRPHRVLQPACAEVEPDVGGRAAHAAGRRQSGGGRGIHAEFRDPERAGLHRPRHGPGRFPAALHLLLRHLGQLLRGDREVPRGAPNLGAHHARPARRQGSEVVALQVPRPDLRRGPHAPAAAEQHFPRHRAGNGRHPGRPAVAAHRRLRRGPVGAQRRRRAHRRGHAEHPARGSAPHRRDRSAGRQLLHREAHRRHGNRDRARDEDRGGRRRHVQGRRKRPGAAHDRRVGAQVPAAHRRRRADRRRRQRVPGRGGQQRTPDQSAAGPRGDAGAHRCVQGVQGAALAGQRCKRALDALARAAGDPGDNVFGRVVEAAEAGCTHGEICDTLRRELGFGHVQAIV